MSAGSVLVTGGAGFVGSHVVDELLAGGWDVRVLDNLHPAVHAGGAGPPYMADWDQVEVIHGDVRDGETVRQAVNGVDAISHQAGMVGLEPSFADAPAFASHNDLGTAVLLAGLVAAGFGGRFVLASSMVVYGEGRYECAEHGVVAPGPRRAEDLDARRFEPTCPVCGVDLAPGPVGEDAPPDPRNVYAATKVHQEHLTWAWSRTTGSPAIALRYHNVYGPRMPRDSSYAGVAAIFASAARAGRAPRVFEDGGQLRDFVHVRDVARANGAALNAPASVTGPFNVCSGEPRTVGEVARTIATDGNAEITGEWRAGDVRHVFASAQRATAELGFRAREGFAEGMRELAQSPLREPI